jgi:hypothetical protein
MRRLGLSAVAAGCIVGFSVADDEKPKPKSVPATTLRSPGDDPAKAADDKKPETREQKLAAIRKDMSAEQSKLVKEWQEEKDPAAKDKLRAKIIGLPMEYAGKALAIAEENPKDDTGFQAIQLTIQFGRGNEAAKKATSLLTTYHVENPKIADSVIGLGRGAGEEIQQFLKAVLARNSDEAAKGRAAYALVQVIADKMETAKTDADVEKLETEAKGLLDRMAKEFANVPLVKLPPNSKAEPRLLGKLAVSEAKGLANIKNLRPGKPVPEIEGPDMDGKTFKISDYKGKVVMLDFWGHW